MALFKKKHSTFDGQHASATSKGIVGAPIFWRPSSNREIVYKYPFDDVRDGALVVVNQTQRAFLFLNGALAAVIPATGEPYKLTTANVPLLGSFLNAGTGGMTAHTAEIWFVNTETERDALWGIGNLPVFDHAVSGEFIIGAHGGYNLKVTDGEVFVRKLVGTIHNFTTDDVVRFFGKKLSSIIAEACSALFEEQQLSIAAVQRSRSKLEREIEIKVNEALETYGVLITNFAIEGFNLPEEYRQVLAEQTRGIAERKRLEQLGVDYSKERQLDIMQSAVSNEGAGGVMGAGLGLGMGMGLGGPMANAMQQTMQNTMAATPPPAGPPPIAPAETPVYFVINGQQAGPYSPAQIPSLVAAGQIDRNSLYWQQGMGQWQPVGSSPALEQYFAATPPPPPTF